MIDIDQIRYEMLNDVLTSIGFMYDYSYYSRCAWFYIIDNKEIIVCFHGDRVHIVSLFSISSGVKYAVNIYEPDFINKIVENINKLKAELYDV